MVFCIQWTGAIVIADEVEKPKHPRQRFTVGY